MAGAIDPRSESEVYDSLKTGLTSKIARLTNFVETSINYVITQAFSEELSDLEVKLLAAQLAGWADYAGGPIEEDQLESLNVDVDDIDELNEFMTDRQLDELGKLVGVSRFEGEKATGKVQITTANDSVEIPEGTTFGTQPDSDGNFLTFQVDADGDGEIEPSSNATVSPSSSSTTVTADVIAEEIGDEYNVGSGTITYMPNPPVGVESVTNSTSTTGGADEQSNDSLREDIKNAITEQSGGGTVEGIKGYIVSNVQGVREGDVILEEFVDKKPPYVDVIVDGGTSSAVTTAIEESRPAAIRHNLVRPEITEIEVDAEVNGTDVDTISIQNAVEEELLSLGISDTFYKDELLRVLMTADEDVINVAQLDLYIQRVTNETFTYDSTQTDYRLEYSHDGASVTIIDDSGTEYTEGTDYSIVDDTGDGVAETIRWDTSNSTPDDGEDFFVDYTVNQEVRLKRDEPGVFEAAISSTFTYDSSVQDYELAHVPLESTLSVTDPDGSKTYTKGTDYTLVSAPGASENDDFIYKSGRTDYKLDYSTQADTVSITDESGESYTRGTDFTVVDTDGDGIVDTIRWDTNNSTPDAEELFSVDYKRQNGIEQTIRWDTSNTTPNNDENFDVSYDRAVYMTNREIVDAPDDKIRDASGNTYTEDTDYQFVDYTADGELDAVEWIDGQPNPDDDEEFYTTYYTEGDLYFSNRKKADPGSITVTVE